MLYSKVCAMASLNPLSTLCLSYLLLTLFLSLAAEPAITSSKSTKIGQGYRLVSIQDDPNGAITGLLQVKEKNDIYGADIPLLRLYVK